MREEQLNVHYGYMIRKMTGQGGDAGKERAAEVDKWNCIHGIDLGSLQSYSGLLITVVTAHGQL